MIYDFQTQLKLGKMVEETLDGYFSTIFQIEPVTLEEEISLGYDRIFTIEERVIKVEYKADFKGHQTGNAYIELEVFSENRSKAGWAKHSQADTIVYAIVNPSGEIVAMYNINRQKLAEALHSWEEKFRIVSCQNKGWKSNGLLVPLTELSKVCSTVLKVKI